MTRFLKSSKSFFWTLLSDLNPGNYPGNTSSDFINRLPESLGIVDRENYECGLVDIRYKPVAYAPFAPPPASPSSSSSTSVQEPQPKRGRMEPVVRQPSVDTSDLFPNLEYDDPQSFY